MCSKKYQFWQTIISNLKCSKIYPPLMPHIQMSAIWAVCPGNIYTSWLHFSISAISLSLTKLFGPNFLGALIFVGQHFFGPNFLNSFRAKIFLDPKFYWTQNYFGPKNFLKPFFEPKIFSDLTFFCVWLFNSGNNKKITVDIFSTGLVRIGKKLSGLVRTGQDLSGLVRTGQDWSELVRTDPDWFGLVRNDQDGSGLVLLIRKVWDRSGQARTGQKRPRQETQGQVETGQTIPRLVRTG